MSTVCPTCGQQIGEDSHLIQSDVWRFNGYKAGRAGLQRWAPEPNCYDSVTSDRIRQSWFDGYDAGESVRAAVETAGHE